MMLRLFRERRERRKLATKLHDALVQQSREPDFYARFGLPDTMLGRYEMVCLHAYLVLTRLQREGDSGRRQAQTLHDMIFDDFDIALREAGLGDMGIGHRIKKLARNLHGRISTYEKGLVEGDAEMDVVLRRNMYASAEPSAPEVSAMIAYIRAARREMDSVTASALFAAELNFPDPAQIGFTSSDEPVT
jgi:cytochrome b pre-mRNA-processing protein 3